MKVAIYARVSTKGKGQSTDNQLPDLRRAAEGYKSCLLPNIPFFSSAPSFGQVGIW